MRIQYFLILVLVLGLNCFAQNKLECKVHSVIRTENPQKTKYVYEILFTVKNIHSEQVIFFFDRERIEDNAHASLTNQLSYRFYQDDKLLEIPVFNKPEKKNALEEEDYMMEIQKKVDSMMKDAQRAKNTKDYFIEVKKKMLESQKTILKKNEEIVLKYRLTWDKLRALNHENTDYYLDEKSKYYLQFSLYLHKKPFEKYFTEEEKKELMSPNFIEENFTSDKFEIFLN